MPTWALAVLALILACLGIWWSYPRRPSISVKLLYDLQGRVEALELRAAQLGEMLTREKRQQLIADAREAKANKHDRVRALADEASALLQASPTSSPAPAPGALGSKPGSESPQVAHARLKAELRLKTDLSKPL